MLLKENVAEFRRGIAVASLPLTIQHAVRVARAVGLPYIWIDALCIIQDDEDDREQEVLSMLGIFAAASLVISAAMANSYDEGFLQPRKPSRLLGNMYKVPCYQEGDSSQDQYYVFSERPISDVEEKEPIDERGWTLQEHILATSLLRFGGKQIRWKCPEFSGTDGGHSERTTSTEFDPEIFDGSYHEGQLARPESFRVRSIRDDFYDHWRRFVANYTTRSLKHQTDALPAFGIVAENFALTVGASTGRYCAGLWENDLARELLWFKPSRIDEAKTKRCGPSWSWASLPGPIEHPYLFLTEANVEVIDCVIQLKDRTWPYGGVVSGVLTVKAQLRSLPWIYPPSIHTNCKIADVISALMDVNVFWDTNTQQDLNHLICLEACPAKNSSSTSHGLILRQNEHCDFQRVGYYECPGLLVELFDRAYLPGCGVYKALRRITLV